MRKPLILAATIASAALIGSTMAYAYAGDSTASSSSAKSSGLSVIGLADGNRLVKFTTADPASARKIGTIKGLAAADSTLVGIDFRVQDGKLYGVGRGGGVYALSTKDATATKFAQLTVALEGTSFGVDFNPAANALRVVSDTGQNLRQPFAAPSATVADTRLSTPPAAGDTTGITAGAYTNNDLDAATGTTLYDISTTSDAVLVQSPANAGTLAPTGSLTVAAEGDAGFDIYSKVSNGVTTDVAAYASLSVNGKRGFYRVALITGKATLAGTFRDAVTDIALPLGQ